MAALLNVYPLPNRPAPDSATTGVSTYTGSSSLQNDQQTYGVRFDHIFNDRLIAFARYNRAPSTRHSQAVGLPYTLINPDYTLGTEMLTLGLTHALTSNMVNESRFNESSQSATGEDGVNRASGAQSPPASLLFPAGDSFQDSSSTFGVSSAPMVKLGSEGQNRTSQIQALDNFSYSLGTHALKLGVDYRRFSSELFGLRFFSYFVLQSLNGSLGAYSGTIPDVLAGRIDSPATAYKTEAFSAYAQDTWRTRRGLAITYGLRWEVDPAPQTAGQAAIIIGLANPHDPTTGHYLRPGEPPYATSWSKFAPRLGIAWQIHDGEARNTVLRFGAGRFFDLGQAGFEGSGFLSHTLFNYTDQPLGSITGGTVFAGAPTTVETAVPALVVARGYTLPYTWQWNLTIEQSIGQQTLSAGYIGALGRRLVGWSAPPQPVNGRYFYTYALNNDASSNYHSMQLQFNRRLSTRLHILVSYTWSHSIDNLSGDFPDTIFAANPLSRGSSNFDVRHSLNGSIIASLPSPRGGIRATFLRNWTANSIFFARSALPTDLFGDQSGNRPNVVPRQPLYLYGSNYPGGRSFNSAAFSVPPAGFDGDLGRNVLRGLGAWQIDFALHREFRLADGLSLQFRAEAFNILNHPNFANPSDPGKVGVLTLPLYPGSGSSTQMLNTGLGPNNVLGQLSSLFQVGGPRTMQLALRIRF